MDAKFTMMVQAPDGAEDTLNEHVMAARAGPRRLLSSCSILMAAALKSIGASTGLARRAACVVRSSGAGGRGGDRQPVERPGYGVA